MSAARGDRRPCLVEGCPGEMQYGRPSEREQAAAPSAAGPRDDDLRWICEESAAHFASDLAAQRVDRSREVRP
jgi:hypothetical protein